MSDQTPFILFGTAHMVTIVIVLIVVFIAPLLIQKLATRRAHQLGRLFAAVLVSNEISNIYIAVSIYGNPLSLSLPLHLCGLAALLTAWMLWRQSYRSYEIVYFWSIGGSIPAILTPDLALGFPHPTFIHFFASHGLIILSTIYATVVLGFRPELRSVCKAILATLLLMGMIAPVDLILDANYMYLCQKPAQNTLMDYFGPWPWYILSLIGIGICIYILCFLPFRFIGNKNNEQLS